MLQNKCKALEKELEEKKLFIHELEWSVSYNI